MAQLYVAVRFVPQRRYERPWIGSLVILWRSTPYPLLRTTVDIWYDWLGNDLRAQTNYGGIQSRDIAGRRCWKNVLWLTWLVGVILALVPDQNQPLMFLGSRSLRPSHPLKSHRRPLVQMYGTSSAKQTSQHLITKFQTYFIVKTENLNKLEVFKHFNI